MARKPRPEKARQPFEQAKSKFLLCAKRLDADDGRYFPDTRRLYTEFYHFYLEIINRKVIPGRDEIMEIFQKHQALYIIRKGKWRYRTIVKPRNEIQRRAHMALKISYEELIQ